jgi:hypothetical protein
MIALAMIMRSIGKIMKTIGTPKPRKNCFQTKGSFCTATIFPSGPVTNSTFDESVGVYPDTIGVSIDDVSPLIRIEAGGEDSSSIPFGNSYTIKGKGNK